MGHIHMLEIDPVRNALGVRVLIGEVQLGDVEALTPYRPILAGRRGITAAEAIEQQCEVALHLSRGCAKGKTRSLKLQGTHGDEVRTGVDPQGPHPKCSGR